MQNFPIYSTYMYNDVLPLSMFLGQSPPSLQRYNNGKLGAWGLGTRLYTCLNKKVVSFPDCLLPLSAKKIFWE